MIKAVIIDDEQPMRELIKHLLSSNFTDILVVGEADSVDDGIEVIASCQPQLVLLDIEIKGGTGFNILQKIKPYDFKLIFITAFNNFAIKAFKFSAMDYILKPVNEFEFVESIERVIKPMDYAMAPMQFDHFIDHYEKKTQHRKLLLRTSEALHLVDIANIIYCKSDNSYTTFFMNNGPDILVSKPMKEYAALLEDYNFIRPHQSFIINIQYVSKIDKSDGGFVILTNGKEIPVSARRKQSFLSELERIK